jgi:pyruvate dehydrogenase E2 component (dihydrolipoamide acetyltransferase)
MATLLRMPEVAANATHATLAAWTCKEGDAVAQGDCLAEIETDKAVVELAAESAGVVGRLFVEAGQEIAVGAPVGILLAVGETDADAGVLLAAAGMQDASHIRSAARDMATTPVAGEPDVRPAVPGPHAPPGPAPAGRVFASPLARRLASEAGLPIAGLAGSGPNGRIVKRDVTLAASRAAADPEPTEGTGRYTETYTEQPHSGMRRTIARRLAESKSSIPHFYLSADCHVDRLLALRKEMNAGTSHRISVNDFVVRAVAMALREVPGANVSWTDTAMRHHADADVAVAVSTDAGLLTPIVRRADTKSLSAISVEIADLARRARAGELRPGEYQGGSFSVSNLGMYGVDEFTAIINPPQAAILAVGAAREQAVVDAGRLGVGSVMRVTLSVDHRAVDGALAAQWLAAFRRLVESPSAMLP